MTGLEDLFHRRVAVSVPGVISAAEATALRARLEPAYARYALFDRGSYDVVDAVAEPAIVARMAEHAAAHAGRTLTLVGARAIRLRAGDYVLARHDAGHDDERVEATLDLSAQPVADADVFYRSSGTVYACFPAAPGTLVVAARDASVTCSHGYVSKLRGAAEVVRLIAQWR